MVLSVVAVSFIGGGNRHERY